MVSMLEKGEAINEIVRQHGASKDSPDIHADRACIGPTHTEQSFRRREVVSCRKMAALRASVVQGSPTGGYFCADAGIATIRKT